VQLDMEAGVGTDTDSQVMLAISKDG